MYQSARLKSILFCSGDAQNESEAAIFPAASRIGTATTNGMLHFYNFARAFLSVICDVRQNSPAGG